MDDNNNRTNEKDLELAKLLNPLKELDPNSLQMQKWKNAIHSASQQIDRKPEVRKSSYKLPLQMIAAMLVGFVLGALLFKNANNESASMGWAKNIEIDATYERFHTNLD